MEDLAKKVVRDLEVFGDVPQEDVFAFRPLCQVERSLQGVLTGFTEDDGHRVIQIIRPVCLEYSRSLFSCQVLF